MSVQGLRPPADAAEAATHSPGVCAGLGTPGSDGEAEAGAQCHFMRVGSVCLHEKGSVLGLMFCSHCLEILHNL